MPELVRSLAPALVQELRQIELSTGGGKGLGKKGHFATPGEDWQRFRCCGEASLKKKGPSTPADKRKLVLVNLQETSSGVFGTDQSREFMAVDQVKQRCLRPAF